MKNQIMHRILVLALIITSSMVFSQYQYPKEFYKTIKEIQAAEDIKPDSALTMAKSCLPKFQDGILQAELYIEISSCYYFMGKNKEALSSALKAKELSYNNTNYNQRARISGLLANRYRDIRLFSKAKASLKEGLVSSDKIENTPERELVKSILLTEYAKNLMEEKKYDSASIYNAKSLRALSTLKKTEKTQFQYTATYLGAGLNYLLWKRWNQAEDHLNKAIASAEGAGWKDYHTSSAKLFLSSVYAHRKEYLRAIDTLKSAEKQTQPDDPKRAELYSYLSENYKAVNDLKNYQKYNDLYLKVRSNLSEEEQKALNETLRIMDVAMKEETDKKNFNKYLLIIFTVLAAVCISGIILYYRKKRKRENSIYEKIIHKLENKYKEVTVTETSSASTLKKNIPANLEKKLLSKLDKFEKNIKFINPKLTLASMAADFETNTHYISEIINMHKQKNFNAYINELRIDYICSKIISDSKYQNYKISYLAEASGFSSHSIFTKTFKNITGISPSTFIDQVKKNNPGIQKYQQN